MPINFPRKVPKLNGDRVWLREMTEDDVPGWFARASNPASSSLSGDPIPDSIDTCFQWLALHRERFNNQEGIRWAIATIHQTESVGSIGLTIISKKDKVAEIGAVIAQSHWSKGIGTAAVKLVVHYAFNILGLSEIQADLLQTNLASKQILEKLGFQFQRDIPDYMQTSTGFDKGYLYVLKNSNNK